MRRCFHRKGSASDGFWGRQHFLGFVFLLILVADSTMINHHFSPPFGNIFLELFPTTLSKSKSWVESINANQSGQIVATENTTWCPPKGSFLEGKSPYFREI